MISITFGKKEKTNKKPNLGALVAFIVLIAIIMQFIS